MRVLRGHPDGWEHVDAKTALSVGVFDGVHRGHRELLRSAFDHEGLPAVVTFDPHPVEVLAPGASPRLLTTIDERLDLFEEIGAGLVAVLNLEDIRYLDPGDFVRSVLMERLGLAFLTVGTDFHFGRDRAGDVAFLKEFSEHNDFEVRAIDLLDVGDEAISSSRIRDLVELGDVFGAAALMGSRFQIRGVVVDGDKRGRSIGFPTANMHPVPGKCLPADGVYATVVAVDGAAHPAATNVGVRPTFGGGHRLIEAYILDFEEDIYGEELTVEFVERLRPELKFDSVDELVEQMTEDVAATRNILGSFRG
jgi:riboflavin kinase/FMN adenylyltransferase